MVGRSMLNNVGWGHLIPGRGIVPPVLFVLGAMAYLRWLLFVAIAVGVTGCDNATKLLAASTLSDRSLELVSGVLSLERVHNQDTAFGLLASVIPTASRLVLLRATATIGTLFIAIVAVSLFKRMLDARKESTEEEPDTTIEDWEPPPPQRRPVPPPLVRTHVPPAMPPQRGPQRSAGPPPLSASLTEAVSALQRQQEMMERLRHAKEAKAQRAKAAGTIQRSAVKELKSTEAPVTGRIAGILRNRGEIRRAVILREVLGPPLGMR